MAVQFSSGLAPNGGQSEETSLIKINQLLYNDSPAGTGGGVTGTFTVGKGTVQDGILTIVNGRITAVQQASN